jgi:HEAT repeat protein
MKRGAITICLWAAACHHPPPSAPDLAPAVLGSGDAEVDEALQHLSDGPMGYGAGDDRLIAMGPRALPALQRAFRRLNTIDAEHAVSIVSRIRAPAGEPILIAALDLKSDRARQWALIGLGEIHAPSALPRLVAALGDRSPAMRLGAVLGLQALGDPAAVAPLARLLEGENPVVIIDQDNRNPHPERLHTYVKAAINRLTGEKLDGDPLRIRKWLESRPRSP